MELNKFVKIEEVSYMYKELTAELRIISSEIAEYNRYNPRGEQLDARIVDVIRMMNRMAWLYIKEGPCRLKEEVSKAGSGFPHIDVWRQIVILVIEGADPELVREISVAKFYVLDLHAHDALAMMIYMEFARSIQMGLHPCAIEELMLAIVPRSIEIEYRKLAEYEKKESWYRAEVHELKDMISVDMWRCK